MNSLPNVFDARAISVNAILGCIIYIIIKSENRIKKIDFKKIIINKRMLID